MLMQESLFSSRWNKHWANKCRQWMKMKIGFYVKFDSHRRWASTYVRHVQKQFDRQQNASGTVMQNNVIIHIKLGNNMEQNRVKIRTKNFYSSYHSSSVLCLFSICSCFLFRWRWDSEFFCFIFLAGKVNSEMGKRAQWGKVAVKMAAVNVTHISLEELCSPQKCVFVCAWFFSSPIFVLLISRHLACVTYFLHFLWQFVFILFSFNSCYRVSSYISMYSQCSRWLCHSVWHCAKPCYSVLLYCYCVVIFIWVFFSLSLFSCTSTHTHLNYK